MYTLTEQTEKSTKKKNQKQYAFVIASLFLNEYNCLRVFVVYIWFETVAFLHVVQPNVYRLAFYSDCDGIKWHSIKMLLG